ncbi:acid protease [Gigaspora margarita]|uniref:Acid protease n=1 Tax=Gigaspora margarita TaxID=4874 RepID=A0A8H4AU20_GIGMA|nr:acid protease [Gigaspora margarita]
MRVLHIFTFAIAIFLSVDALPYDKPIVLTIPLKPKSITHRRISRRAIGTMPLHQDKAYYGQITFGTGTPQNFDIQFDTGSGALFVVGKNCTAPACNHMPNKYDPDVDKSFSLIVGKHFGIKYVDGTEAQGDSGKTTIVIAGIPVEAQEFGLVDEVTDNFKHSYEGVMGMEISDSSGNQQTTPITNLINNNTLDKPQFSFLLGREDDQSPSELIIGGSNPDRYRNDSLTFTHVVDNNFGAWEIPIDDCIVDGIYLNLEGHTVYVDTGAEYIVMPINDAREFYSNIPNAVEYPNGFFTIDCEEEYEVGLAFSGTTWYMDSRDFAIEVSENVCIGAVISSNTGSETKWIIGSAFLKNVYTIFDQGNRQVGFAQLRYS